MFKAFRDFNPSKTLGRSNRCRHADSITRLPFSLVFEDGRLQSLSQKLSDLYDDILRDNESQLVDFSSFEILAVLSLS